MCVVFTIEWHGSKNLHVRERGYLDQPISVSHTLPFSLAMLLFTTASIFSTNLYGESTAVSVMIGDGEQQASNVRDGVVGTP